MVTIYSSQINQATTAILLFDICQQKPDDDYQNDFRRAVAGLNSS
jgi:hypothetical protein